MKIFVGHSEYHDRDFLLTVHDEGDETTYEIATRPGSGERWLHWSAPVSLLPESSDVSS